MDGAEKVGEAEWRRRIETARKSGRTLSDVATQYGAALTTVRYWSQRVGKPVARSAFVQVRPQGDKRADEGNGDVQAQPSSVVIEVGEVRICVKNRADIALAAALVETLTRKDVDS